MQKIKVFETFSEIGAQHKALEILKKNKILDYEIVSTSEWDIWANISYNAIHHNNLNIAVNLTNEEIDSFLLKFTHSNDSKSPMTKEQVLKLPRLVKENLYSSIKNSNNLESITEISADTLIKNAKNFDLLTYSFPCQDLSTAGSFHGNNKGMKKNSGTRSGLLWEIERILKDLKHHNQLPKYLLLENVNNMLSERHKDDYVEWLNFLNSIGYKTQTYVLEANKYGTPQNRKRVFAFSVRKNISKNFKDTFQTSNGSIIKETNAPVDISNQIKIKKNIYEILKEDYSIEKYKEEASKATPNRTKSRKKMFENNKMLSTKVQTNIKKHKNNTFTKDDNIYSLFSSTITTKQDKDPNGGFINLKGTILEDKFNYKMNIKKADFRLLTPRKCFLLMGFEENDFQKILNISYEINLYHMKRNKYLGDAVLYRQSGNSIVVNVLVAIFNKIAEIEGKLKNEK